MPAGARRRNLEAEVAKALAAVEKEVVPHGAAARYAVVKATCVRSGVALSENDLWIAASAMVLGATLVTRDRDFTRVAGLTIEDWTQ
jgi:tRNA(fMet)-specific endonuclease VapC